MTTLLPQFGLTWVECAFDVDAFPLATPTHKLVAASSSSPSTHAPPEPAADAPYVVHLAYARISESHGMLAVASSDLCIRCYVHSRCDGRLAPQTLLSGHAAPITGLAGVPGQDSLLLSSSEDGSVALWNIASQQQQQQRQQGGGEVVRLFKYGSPLTCVASNGTHVAAGVDMSVALWDLHTGQPIGVIADMHNEPVTFVRFHPALNTMLFSGAEDGLVNHYNLTADDVDDMLETVVPTGQDVRKFGFFGHSSEFLYCISRVETLSLWDIDSGELIHDFGSGMRDDLSRISEMPVNYVIDCSYDAEAERLYMFAGTFDGHLMLFHVNATSIQPVCLLSDAMAHSDTIRDVVWNEDAVISAGEDGLIGMWSFDPLVLQAAADAQTQQQLAQLSVQGEEDEQGGEESIQ